MRRESVPAPEPSAVPRFRLSWRDIADPQRYSPLVQVACPAHHDRAFSGRNLRSPLSAVMWLVTWFAGVLREQGEKADPPTPLQMDMAARVDELLKFSQRPSSGCSQSWRRRGRRCWRWVRVQEWWFHQPRSRSQFVTHGASGCVEI